jgi:hypothetical protein
MDSLALGGAYNNVGFEGDIRRGYIGDLCGKYNTGGMGTYRRPNGTSTTWTKQ